MRRGCDQLVSLALVQSLLSFAQQHQNHAGQDNNSHLFLLIALIIVLRYATITFINTKISHQAALNGAYQQYSAFNVPSKTAKWAAISTTWTTEDIVAFINSIPWDMNTAQ
ncbi:hypothetical protein B0H14DRAFT_121554 [Mycena olivaceomarginata]|nr:hypothetical protein B0H14DRAFT_121554 [Mycena olivaceomarginata]